MTSFDGKYENVYTVIMCTCALDVTVSDILTFQMFNLQK